MLGVTPNTPLAPSVEAAYYRKCLELKRRLNEIETHNDAARSRRARIERAVMSLRLERSILLDAIRKRMADANVDGSEESGDEVPEVRTVVFCFGSGWEWAVLGPVRRL